MRPASQGIDPRTGYRRGADAGRARSEMRRMARAATIQRALGNVGEADALVAEVTRAFTRYAARHADGFDPWAKEK